MTCDVALEDSDCLADVSFANSRLSKHLFEGAVAQEEILMATRPELCVAALLCGALEMDEVVIVSGCRKTSEAKGYGKSLRCLGTQDEDRLPLIL